MKRVKKVKFSKKRFLFRKKSFFIQVTIFLIFIFLCWFIFFSSFFQIKKIEIKGNQRVQKEILFSFLEEKLSGKIYFLPKKNIFLIKSLKLENQILNNFPQFSKINFKVKFPNTLICFIKEREPRAVLVTENQKFLLDEDGVVFEIFNPEFGFLPIIKSHLLPTNLYLGQKAIPKEIVFELLKINESLTKELDLKIKEIEFFSEEKIQVVTQENWKIFFKIGEREWQILKLKTLLKEELPKEKREKLDYIDVRFENFAPFKFKD